MEIEPKVSGDIIDKLKDTMLEEGPVKASQDPPPIQSSSSPQILKDHPLEKIIQNPKDKAKTISYYRD